MKKLFLLIALLCLATPSPAVTKKSLHTTQVEIDEYNVRRVSGPYTDGWTRILANADSFKTTPTQGTWLGNQLSTAWLGLLVQNCQQSPNVLPGGSHPSSCRGSRSHGAKVRDAGFVYMVTGDTNYSTPVRNFLLTQAAVAGTDFSNTTKWPTNYVTLSNNGWTHDDHFFSIWFRELLYAYSYTKDTFSAGEKTTMETWFENAATWMATVQHDEVDAQFPSRLTGSWTEAGTQGSAVYGKTHLTGTQVYQFHFPWQNKRANLSAFVAAVAAEFGDTTLKNHAKTFIKEWLMFQVYADGSIAEQARWTASGDAGPQNGWQYATTAFGSIITAVDHLARAGDTEMYTWTTSEGRYGTEGGPKSLLMVLQHYSDLHFHNTSHYASTSGTESWRLFDADGENPNPVVRRYINDLGICQASVFYNDAKVTSLCQRAVPTSPSSQGYNPWGGDWGNLPDARFMFAAMANISDAYDPVTPPGETPTINVQQTSSVTDANATTWPVVLATPCVTGDLHLWLVASDATSTVTFPIGTDLSTTAGPSNGFQLDTAYKVSAAETGSINVTTSQNDRSAHQTYCLSSQHASSAPEIATATGTSTSADPPSITPSWGSDDETTLFISGLVTNSGVTTSAAPTGYTNLTSSDSTGSSQGVNLVTSRRHALTASENPSAYTLSSSAPWIAFTIAVRPQEPAPTTHTFTQSRCRFYEYYNTSESSPTALAAADTNISVAPQGVFLLRCKVRGKVLDPPSVNLVLRYSRNSGAYTALTDAYANGVKYSGEHVAAVASGTPTTEILTSDETTNVAGKVALTSAPITWNATLDSEGEFVWGIKFDSATAAAGDTYDFRIYLDDGTALTAYTVTPRVTIVAAAAGSGF